MRIRTEGLRIGRLGRRLAGGYTRYLRGKMRAVRIFDVYAGHLARRACIVTGLRGCKSVHPHVEYLDAQPRTGEGFGDFQIEENR